MSSLLKTPDPIQNNLVSNKKWKNKLILHLLIKIELKYYRIPGLLIKIWKKCCNYIFILFFWILEGKLT